MKKIALVFLILILSINFVHAQYKRKLKEPDFFIPYSDRMHKPEVLTNKKNNEKTTNKTYKNNEKDEISFNIIPYYKKIYDNYIKEMNIFFTTKKFTENSELDSDINMMNSGDSFIVEDDNTSTINTKEQYDFYMLAIKLLKN